jgi:5-methylcytosine-specific restriction protein A
MNSVAGVAGVAPRCRVLPLPPYIPPLPGATVQRLEQKVAESRDHFCERRADLAATPQTSRRSRVSRLDPIGQRHHGGPGLPGRAFLMPRASLRPCTYPRCGALVASGRCERHTFKRKGSTARGYGSRWQRARAAHLARNPLCVECKRQGRTTEANTVDHITPHRNDAGLFWDQANWQSLCATCHSGWKQRQERAWGGGVNSCSLGAGRPVARESCMSAN